MLHANFNTYNNYVTDSLYQWDVNQDLVISGLGLSVAPEIHFANADMDRALVRQSTLESGVVTVRIPNSLLQAALTIKAYVGLYEGETFKVIETIEIPVIAKAKPADYTIEDSDEEIYSFNQLENEIANAKKDIADLCEANRVEMVATVEKATEDLENSVEATTRTLSAQVANIIAHNNETDGNTELIDIRTGADGTVYDSAGEAVREQFRPLRKAIVGTNILSGYYKSHGGFTADSSWAIIEIPVIGGKAYEYNGLTSVGNTPVSWFYNGDKQLSYFKQATGKNCIVVPEYATNIRFSVSLTDIVTFSVKEIVSANSEDINHLSEKVTRLSKGNGDFSGYLMGGNIDNTGNHYVDSRRLKFCYTEKNPFIVKMNPGYLVRSVVYYDKETDEFIKMETISATEYVSHGDYGIRLIFCKTALESNISIDEAESMFVDLAFGSLTNNLTRHTLEYLPKPYEKMFAVFDNPNRQLLWSDKYVWRTVAENKIATTAGGYQTIKVSDGTVIGGDNVNYSGPIFSITKVITALLTTRYVDDLSKTTTVVSTLDTHSSCVKAGDIVTYETLLNCALIFSDNSAARELARSVGYIIDPEVDNDTSANNAFVVEMRKLFVELDMTNTMAEDLAAASGVRSTPEDICKLFKYVYDNCPVITEIWGKLTYNVTVTGDNARTWTISSTTSEADRKIIPEFIGGKTGSSDTLGSFGFVWKDNTDNEVYISVFLIYPLSTGKTANARQIIDEVYSLKQG